jgi:hypothetical protein
MIKAWILKELYWESDGTPDHTYTLTHTEPNTYGEYEATEIAYTELKEKDTYR